MGKVPVGLPVGKCSVPGTVAITYDDGPSDYTDGLLDILKKAEAKATFFVNGVTNGRGEIDQKDKWIHILRRMDTEGHQVASHSWSHFDLDKLDSRQRRDEMFKNERAIANILGKYPTYMRAPYINCDSACLRDMKDLRYKVVEWNVDSTDAEHPTDLEDMKGAVDAAFAKAPDTGEVLLIQHDTLSTSALQLTRHILSKIKEKRWKAVTVAECLGESLRDAYHVESPA
jgi:peptidoglycan/xylan/chitin deacetylase (PgdA/CDA1 family)